MVRKACHPSNVLFLGPLQCSKTLTIWGFRSTHNFFRQISRSRDLSRNGCREASHSTDTQYSDQHYSRTSTLRTLSYCSEPAKMPSWKIILSPIISKMIFSDMPIKSGDRRIDGLWWALLVLVLVFTSIRSVQVRGMPSYMDTRDGVCCRPVFPKNCLKSQKLWHQSRQMRLFLGSSSLFQERSHQTGLQNTVL